MKWLISPVRLGYTASGSAVYESCAGGGFGIVVDRMIAQPQGSDEALVERLRQRDSAALEQIYARHARAVYSLVLRLVGDVQVAEDILQECFLKLWREPERFIPNRGRLLPWLLGVAHHRSVDWLRRRNLERRHQSNGELPLPDSGETGDPALSFDGAFRSEVVGRALASLPDPQRTALELAYLRGMTQSEIAAYLGEPLGTVKTRTRLALQKLRAILDRADFEEVGR